MSFNKNKVVVISGSSGSGKNFLTKQLFKEIDSTLIVSSTTRPIRDYDGEVDGLDYHFVSREEFEKDVSNNAFVEYEDVFGNYYGTKKSEFFNAFNSGKMPIAIVDPAGNANLCNKLHEMGFDTFSVFVDCPRNHLTHRLLDRLISAQENGNEKAIKDAIKRLNSSFTEERTWKNSVNYDFIAYGLAKETVLKIQINRICTAEGSKENKDFNAINIDKKAPKWVLELDYKNISIEELKDIQNSLWSTPLLSRQP